MNLPSLFRYVYLAYLSQPPAERQLYRLIRRHRPRRIVEVGVGCGERALRAIDLAARYTTQRIHYAGIDQFEARAADQPGLTLKRAHRLFTATGARVRLIPGDPYTALVRAANILCKTDLLFIAGDQDMEAMASAWFYVPRMLHERSLVICEAKDAHGTMQLRLLSRAEIDELARAGCRALRRAA